MSWWVYLLRCADGSLYTGITDDVHRRIEQHNSGQGAKYTRGRGPVILRYQEVCGSHGDALRREIQIKRLSKQEKLDLIAKE